MSRYHAVEMLYGRMSGLLEVQLGTTLVEELGERASNHLAIEAVYGVSLQDTRVVCDCCGVPYEPVEDMTWEDAQYGNSCARCNADMCHCWEMKEMLATQYNDQFDPDNY